MVRRIPSIGQSGTRRGGGPGRSTGPGALSSGIRSGLGLQKAEKRLAVVAFWKAKARRTRHQWRLQAGAVSPGAARPGEFRDFGDIGTGCERGSRRSLRAWRAIASRPCFFLCPALDLQPAAAERGRVGPGIRSLPARPSIAAGFASASFLAAFPISEANSPRAMATMRCAHAGAVSLPQHVHHNQGR